MESATGIVTAIDEMDGCRIAWIDVESIGRCRRCAAGRGCGAGLVSDAAGLRRLRMPLPPDTDIAVGAKVRLSMPERDVLRAAVLAYGWPLAGAAAGVAGTVIAGAGDALTALAALAGLSAGAVIARQRLREPGCVARLTPRIVR